MKRKPHYILLAIGIAFAFVAGILSTFGLGALAGSSQVAMCACFFASLCSAVSHMKL